MAETKQGRPRGDGFFVDDCATASVGGFTGSKQIQVAEKAAAARNHERDHHAVTGLYRRHGRAGFFHDAHEFMAENVTVFGLGDFAAVQVQVRATNGRGSHPQNEVVIFFNDRVRHGIDFDVMSAVVSECSHACTPLTDWPVLTAERGLSDEVQPF